MKYTILTIIFLFFFQSFFPTTDNNSFVKDGDIISMNGSDNIQRTIDVSNTFRDFPNLAGYWNTSLQKATTPIIANIAENSYGKAKIVRCWLNLDEMWDYRTREFDYNFVIGVDKYKNITEKFRESWNWEVETPIHFYDYLKSFSNHSEEVLLNIRRYERDIMDNNIPVSKEDYKNIIKEGLKHYKKMCPNIKYVQIGNEYNGGSFMKATEEEYYPFYKIGYEAVNEVNKELELKGNKRILVGMSPPAGNTLERLGRLFNLYKNDTSKTKRLDFISWHEYGIPIPSTANREKEIKFLIKENDLPNKLPLFITEHDPFHGSYQDKQFEHHMLNASYLPKSLYFTSLNSPQVKVFPWVLYHNEVIQTKFMWFKGPNETLTKENEIQMLPLGCSMKFLSMMKGEEIKIDNSIEGNDLVIATSKKGQIEVEVINYIDKRDVVLNLHQLNKVFTNKKGKKVHLVKYLIDDIHSNCITNKNYQGGIEKIEDTWVEINQGMISLKHNELKKNGIVFWEIKDF
jgi:hypothetical protein